MFFCFLIRSAGTEKGEEKQPEHVETSQCSRRQSDQPEQPVALGTGERLPEDFIFGEKPGQRRNAGNGQGGS